MNLDNINNDWQEEAPKLASIKNKNPFSVPEGYFDSLGEHLNSRIFLLEIHPEKANEFTVPEGYFDTLTDHIEGRIFTEKLKEEVIGNNFTVPEGYFDTLQTRLNERIEEPVKVISIRRRLVPSWLSYAAAACIMIAVSSGLYFNIKNNRVNTPAKTSTTDLSKVSDDEILQYLKVRSTRQDMPAIVETLGDNIPNPVIDEDIPTEDLQEYLNNNL
jgi:hypothetical protein